MTRYYVFCSFHGKIGPYFNDKNAASRYRGKHKRANPGCSIKVILEYSYEKYGKTMKAVKIAR